MTFATASECEIITTCEAPSTTDVARGRARSAMKACNFGGIAVSRSPYTNQDGTVFQAGSVAGSLNAMSVTGLCAAAASRRGVRGHVRCERIVEFFLLNIEVVAATG